jgi:hypothetical protein
MTDPLAAAIAEVRAKAAGRTRYVGQAPYPDELLVAEIDALRAAVREANNIKAHYEHRKWQVDYVAVIARAKWADRDSA